MGVRIGGLARIGERARIAQVKPVLVAVEGRGTRVFVITKFV